jgi:hypothetical protein
MRHIDLIVWKPIDWWPESADQYPDGLPPAKPETVMVEAGESRWLMITGLQLGGTVDVFLIERPGEEHVWPNGQVTRHVASGPIPEKPILSIDAARVPEVVDALLYIHRRTHEHEYEGPDAGLPDPSGNPEE